MLKQIQVEAEVRKLRRNIPKYKTINLMARQKQVSIESVYNDFELLGLSDKVEVSKLIQGHLEDQKTIKQNEIAIAQNAIAKLDEVVKTN